MSAAALQSGVVSEDDTPQAKRISTLAAQLALRGLQLHELAGGGWLICDHARSLHAPDLRAVSRFIDCGH